MSEGNSSSTNKCANTGCNETGRLKCSACSSVYYCSSQCQKAHWTAHKTQCKQLKAANTKPASVAVSPVAPSPVNNNAGPPVDNEQFAEFQALKNEIQKYFNHRDFENAAKKSEEAIQMAKSFPSHIALPETIQIQVNLSTAFLHMNKLKEAESYANSSVASAEINVSQRTGQPQAIEILTVALGCKAVAILTAGRIPEALEAAQKALTLAETIYPKNDPRLHKSLRTLGLIQEKKGDLTDAERTIVRAYTIICIAAGPASPEAQVLVDDLVNMFSRKQDLEAAERYAEKNYKTISDKKSNLSERELYFLADSASRLAALYVKKGEFGKAEKLVAEALEIRDNAQFLAMNPMGIAFSLTQLVGVREELGKLGSEEDNELENMLLRAIDIFSRLRGNSSPEVMNSLTQLRRIRQKKQDPNSITTSSSSTANANVNANGVVSSSSSSNSEKKKANGGKGGSDDDNNNEEDEDGDLQYSVTSESKLNKLSNNNTQTTETMNRISSEDYAKISAIPSNDGIARMQLANEYFQQNKFHIADILIEQAYMIFVTQYGEDHVNTKAAKQNLQAVRNNRINQLWLQVVTEELLVSSTSTNDEIVSDTANATVVDAKGMITISFSFSLLVVCLLVLLF